MPRFLAICADPKDGPDYKISVEAPDRSAALNKLRTRHTVTRLLDDSAETPAPGEQPMEEVPFSDRALERIAADLAKIARSPLITSPFATITMAIIAAFIACAILVFLLGLVVPWRQL